MVAAKHRRQLLLCKDTYTDCGYLSHLQHAVRAQQLYRAQTEKKRRINADTCTTNSLVNFAHFGPSAVFWRKCDAKEWLNKARRQQSGLKGSILNLLKNGYEYKDMLLRMQRLLNLTPRQNSTLTVLKLDGTSLTIDVPVIYYQYVDSQGGGLQACMSTVGDIKVKIEEISGVEAISQTLHTNNDKPCLEDDQTIAESGLVGDQTLYLTIDTQNKYWHQHAMLVRKYLAPLMQSCRTIKKAILRARCRDENSHFESHHTAHRFLMCCHKAITFLNQRRATHQPLSISVLERCSSWLDQKLPMLQAIAENHRTKRAHRNGVQQQ